MTVASLLGPRVTARWIGIQKGGENIGIVASLEHLPTPPDQLRCDENCGGIDAAGCRNLRPSAPATRWRGGPPVQSRYSRLPVLSVIRGLHRGVPLALRFVISRHDHAIEKVRFDRRPDRIADDRLTAKREEILARAAYCAAGRNDSDFHRVLHSAIAVVNGSTICDSVRLPLHPFDFGPRV